MASQADITDPGTILFGDDGACSQVNCVGLLSGSPLTKAVEVEYEGIRAIAKCWTEKWFEKFVPINHCFFLDI
jgi:hypothetical protein